ncbi:hypothetical protein BHE74_00030002 [Ensete ventricosum]|nr:hypothetical protein BHE74_00030002 [Ensete ventricosum]RZR96454.1 hypothetical protein BHM03_00025479 [Ensete ventricosum]
MAGSGPCALARPWSSRRRGGGAQLNGGSFQVRLDREEAGSLELGSTTNSCKKVGWGSRCDLSDGQVSLIVNFAIPLLRGGAGAFIVKGTRRSYLRSLLSMLLTMPSYFVAASVVLAVTRASCFLQLGRVDLAHLTRVKSVVRLLTPPYLCQAGSTVSGRPHWRSSYLRV